MDRIKNWLGRLGDRMRQWMYGRYGQDELTHFCYWAALLCILASLFIWPGFFCGLAMALYLVAMLRMYSKNITARRRERDAYLRLTQPIRSWSQLQRRRREDRGTHKYYHCPKCAAVLRVPKGKGKIRIRCPKCSAELVKKT